MFLVTGQGDIPSEPHRWLRKKIKRCDNLICHIRAQDIIIMLNHTTSTTPRRTRRFSGISESFEVLRTNSSKKRKITPENESQRTEANPETELIKSRKKSRLPSRLSNDLVPHFQIQKKAVLFALKNPNFSKSYFSSDTKAIEQLEELVHGTVDRQEGNSCLILGARGSGKTKVS